MACAKSNIDRRRDELEDRVVMYLEGNIHQQKRERRFRQSARTIVFRSLQLRGLCLIAERTADEYPVT